jgi:hypothetical protein
MELPTSPIRGARTPMEAPATPSGSSNGSAGAPSLLTSHPLVDYLLSLEEGGSLTPQVLNLLFAAVRLPAPTQSSSVTICASITLDLLSSSIVHDLFIPLCWSTRQLLGGPPSREVGAALAERIVQIKRPNTLPVLLAAICHFPEHERKDRTKTQEQRDKLNNVYMDGLTLLDKLAAKSVSNLALCVATRESFHRWRLPCALLDCLPQVQNQQFLGMLVLLLLLLLLLGFVVLESDVLTRSCANSECAAFGANSGQLQRLRAGHQAASARPEEGNRQRSGAWPNYKSVSKLRSLFKLC